MSSLLDRVRDHPLRHLGAGEVLIAEGAADPSLFVLVEGRLAVERAGQRVAVVDQAGAVLGEISMLLEVPATATVSALGDAVVHELDPGDDSLLGDAEVMGELARLLAGRLQQMLTYLVDVKNQYADAGGHLGMIDDVLGQLTFGAPRDIEPGSERDPDPYY